MSRTFFNALGQHFLQKHAGRVPWGLMLSKLREHEVIPEVIPRLPFVEEPELIPIPIEPIGPAIPEELLEPEAKEEPAPEPRPKSKPKGEKTPKPD
jgi:hypothetical protein